MELIKKPLISIVVPVYNCAQYLNKCMESILSQTLREIEVILVENGSTDSSLQKCKEYVEKDSRVRLFSLPCADVSAARNLGIQQSEAPYIGFVDADDWIDPEMYESMLAEASALGPDCGAVCAHVKEEQNKQTLNTHNIGADKKTVSGKVLLDKICRQEVHAPVWGFLMPRHIVKAVPFPEGRFHEDCAVIHQWGWRLNRCAIINSAFYHYRIREGSIMTAVIYKTPRGSLDDLTNRIERINFLKKLIDDGNEDIRELLDITAWLLMDSWDRLLRRRNKFSVSSSLASFHKQVKNALSGIKEVRLHKNSETSLTLKFKLFILRHSLHLSIWENVIMERLISGKRKLMEFC